MPLSTYQNPRVLNGHRDGTPGARLRAKVFVASSGSASPVDLGPRYAPRPACASGANSGSRYREQDGKPLFEQILDSAGQKGTGKRAAVAALEIDEPFTTAASAVFARFLSARKSERTKAGQILSGAPGRY